MYTYSTISTIITIYTKYMNSTSLKLHQNKITIPSFFRKRFPTNNYLAVDNGKELVIKPILDSEPAEGLLEFYEALNDSLEGRVTKQKSPEDYLKKLRHA